MIDFNKALKHKQKLMPEEGVNLVAVDTMEEELEDKAYVVQNFKDEASAEKMKKELEKDGDDIVKYYLYTKDEKSDDSKSASKAKKESGTSSSK